MKLFRVQEYRVEMTADQQARLRQKLWVNRARTVRPPIARTIATALGIDVPQIEFADLDLTESGVTAVPQDNRRGLGKLG